MKTRQGRPRLPNKPEAINEALMVKPNCFDWSAWHDYRGHIRRNSTPVPHSACEDCTPEYQAQMIAANRCEQPQVVFFRDSEGFVFGSHPNPSPYLVKKQAEQ